MGCRAAAFDLTCAPSAERSNRFRCKWRDRIAILSSADCAIHGSLPEFRRTRVGLTCASPIGLSPVSKGVGRNP